VLQIRLATVPRCQPEAANHCRYHRYHRYHHGHQLADITNSGQKKSMMMSWRKPPLAVTLFMRGT